MSVRIVTPGTMTASFNSLSEVEQGLFRDALGMSSGGGTGGIVPISGGGTGATSASAARASLGAQATLVSGTTIKTVNGESILGSGNIVISGGSTTGGVVSIKDFGATGNGTGSGDSAALESAQAASSSIYIPDGTYIVNSAPALGKCWGPGKMFLSSNNLTNQIYISPTPGPVNAVFASVFNPPETSSGIDAGPYLQKALDIAQEYGVPLVFPKSRDYKLTTGLVAKAGKSSTDVKGYNVFIDFGGCILRPGPGVTGLFVNPRCLYADVPTGRGNTKIDIRNAHWDGYFGDASTVAMKFGKPGYQIMGWGGVNTVEDIIVESSNWKDGATAIIVEDIESVEWRGLSIYGRFLIRETSSQFTGDMKFYTSVFVGKGDKPGNYPLHLQTSGGTGSGNGRSSQVRGINFTNCYIYGSGSTVEAAGAYTQIGDVYFTDTQWDQPNLGPRAIQVVTSGGTNEVFNFHFTSVYFGGFSTMLYVNNGSSSSTITSFIIAGLYSTVWNSPSNDSSVNSGVYLNGVRSLTISTSSIFSAISPNSSTSVFRLNDCRNFTVSGNTSVDTSGAGYGITVSGNSDNFVIMGNVMSVSNSIVNDVSTGANKQVIGNLKAV